MKVEKAQNMLHHKDEILSKPQRTWFQSQKEKEAGHGTRIIFDYPIPGR